MKHRVIAIHPAGNFRIEIYAETRATRAAQAVFRLAEKLKLSQKGAFTELCFRFYKLVGIRALKPVISEII